MKDLNTKVKSIAIKTMIVFNIALAGAVAGGYIVHQYDTKQSKTTEQAVQAALKSVPVAQASAPSK